MADTPSTSPKSSAPSSKKSKVRPPSGEQSGAQSRAGKSPVRAKESHVQNEEALLKSVGSVVVRNEFYRDGYRSILRIAVIEALIIVCLIGAIFFVVQVHQPKDVYFATTQDGRLIPMMDLRDPNLTDPALVSWAAQAATEVMTFGFNDYKRRIQESARNFTRIGWITYTGALEESRIIERVEKQQEVVFAVPVSAPVITEQGVAGGRYQWKVQVNLRVTYQSGSTISSKTSLIDMLIVRVPKLENPNGVGIEQWNAR